jgi:hypothetical protein
LIDDYLANPNAVVNRKPDFAHRSAGEMGGSEQWPVAKPFRNCDMS